MSFNLPNHLSSITVSFQRRQNWCSNKVAQWWREELEWSLSFPAHSLPQSHSISQHSVSIGCFPHSVTAQVQEPLPAGSNKEEDNIACRVQRNETFLAMLSSSLPKSERKEFLLFLRLTSCHVLAAQSILSHLLCLGLWQCQLCFGLVSPSWEFISCSERIWFELNKD